MIINLDSSAFFCSMMRVCSVVMVGACVLCCGVFYVTMLTRSGGGRRTAVLIFIVGLVGVGEELSPWVGVYE